MSERLCARCGALISQERLMGANRSRVIFCSKTCAQRPRETPDVALNTGKSGAISELLVTADLLRRGYDVFRAVSQSCSCDIMALRDGVAKRIEVRTGFINPAHGTLSTSLKDSDIGRFDVLAVVYDQGNHICYIPDLTDAPLPALNTTLLQKLSHLLTEEQPHE